MGTESESLTLLAADPRFEWWRGPVVQGGMPVLMKRLRNKAPAAAEVAALRRECALAAELPCLAALHARWNDAPALWFDDPGGALASQAGRLPIAAALAIASQLAVALAELHGRGLVHRGVRPDAIVCRPDAGRAWLIDWADAAPAGQAVAAPATIARLVYVAPEQTGRIDAPVDARSDLYALGIVNRSTGTSPAARARRPTSNRRSRPRCRRW
jgi:hypothetical protein